MSDPMSREREKTAIRMLRANRAGLDTLPPTARLMYAVGLLACDEVGFISKADLAAAVADENTARRALELLAATAVS